MILLDNNVLASDYGLDQIDRMSREQVWVDFNQGLDARLITPEIARMLARLHWIRFVRLACDTSEMLPAIRQAAAYLKEAGVAQSRLWSYRWCVMWRKPAGAFRHCGKWVWNPSFSLIVTMTEANRQWTILLFMGFPHTFCNLHIRKFCLERTFSRTAGINSKRNFFVSFPQMTYPHLLECDAICTALNTIV